MESVPMEERAPRVLVALADGCSNVLGELAQAGRAASILSPAQRDTALATAAAPHQEKAGCTTRRAAAGPGHLHCTAMDRLGAADQALRDMAPGAHAYMAAVVHALDSVGAMDATAVRLAETFVLASAMSAAAGR